MSCLILEPVKRRMRARIDLLKIKLLVLWANLHTQSRNMHWEGCSVRRSSHVRRRNDGPKRAAFLGAKQSNPRLPYRHDYSSYLLTHIKTLDEMLKSASVCISLIANADDESVRIFL